VMRDAEHPLRGFLGPTDGGYGSVEPEIGDVAQPHVLPRPVSGPRRAVRASVAGLLTLASGAAVLALARPKAEGAQSTALAAASQLRISVSNEYDTISGGEHVWAQGAYPWLRSQAHLVEPHRVTTLELEIGAAGPDDGTTTVLWTIEESGSGEGRQVVSTSTSSRQLHHVFTGLKRFSITACMEESGASFVSLCAPTTEVVCRYVRREIRALKPADRELVLTTMATLRKITTSEGQTKFDSEAYRDYAHFSRQHLVQTSSRRGDELHDGMGFLTAHVAQANVFERALQAVNPAIALPYWDYTKEAAAVATLQAEDSSVEAARELWGTKVSPLWTNEWFGEFPTFNLTTEAEAEAKAETNTRAGAEAAGAHSFPSGNADLDSSVQTVTEGRWAYMRIPKAAKTDTVQSPWGYLRAPWNFNRFPFLTRGHDLCGVPSLGSRAEATLGLVEEIFPSCATHLAAATSSAYSSWRNFAWMINYKPHGHVHTAIGGTHGCAAAYDRLNGVLSAYDLTKLRYSSFTSLRNLWRRFPNTVELPSFCSDDAVDACKPSCDAAAVKSDAALREAMWSAVFDWQAVNLTLEGRSSEGHGLRRDDGDYSAEVKTKVLATICDTAIGMGEQTQASSPFDPSFHFQHTTLERLYQLRVLTGGFSDDSMAWSDEGTCIWGECVGHRANDTLYEAVYAHSDEAGGFAPMSALAHHELRALMDPTSDKMPYVYAHFSFPHCESQGVHFPTLENFTEPASTLV